MAGKSSLVKAVGGVRGSHYFEFRCTFYGHKNVDSSETPDVFPAFLHKP